MRTEIPVDIYGTAWLAEQNSSGGGRATNQSDHPAPGSVVAYSRVIRENIAKQGWLGVGIYIDKNREGDHICYISDLNRVH